MVEERWYTVADIVDLLKVHEQTVRRWLRDGELRGYDLGGKSGYRVKAADFEAFIESRLAGPAGKAARGLGTSDDASTAG